AWVQACLIAFVYLEWYRARQLRRRGLRAAVVAVAAQLRRVRGPASGRGGPRPDALVSLGGGENRPPKTAPVPARRAPPGRQGGRAKPEGTRKVTQNAQLQNSRFGLGAKTVRVTRRSPSSARGTTAPPAPGSRGPPSSLRRDRANAVATPP